MYETETLELIKDEKMDSGLIKIISPSKHGRFEEIALVLPDNLAEKLNLANNILCYRATLKDFMLASNTNGGVNAHGAFSGKEIRDEAIDNIEGRVVTLKAEFTSPYSGFKPILIPLNHPEFNNTIDTIKKALHTEGFDVDSSRWRGYTCWETDKLRYIN